MKVKYFVTVLLFGILIVACTKEKLLQEYMIGSWQTTYLKLEMPTYEKSNALEINENKFDSNSDLIAQSKYNADGTFNAWFINKNGEKISKSEGIWRAKNDSLYIEFYYGEKEMKVSYHITKTEEGFLAKSTYDWDSDGDFDDFLTMETKRIKLD